jgi:hypothetical protein
MTAHAGMASHNLQEEEPTEFIPPRRRPGSEYFIPAAIGAVIPSNPTHEDNLSNQTVKESGTGHPEISSQVAESRLCKIAHLGGI